MTDQKLVDELEKALTDEAYDGGMGVLSGEEFSELVRTLAATAAEVVEEALTPTDDEREALCDQCGEVFSEHSCRPIPSCIHVPPRRADLCEWCDMSARGNAHHPAHDQPRRSCGEQYHGEDFKPDPEPQEESSSEREALAQTIKDVTIKWSGPSMAEFANTPPIRKHYATADAILAAGFRRTEPQGEPSEGGVVLWVGHLTETEDLCLDEFDLPAAAGVVGQEGEQR